MNPGAIIGGRFQIEWKAGEGGMGVVFRGLDHRDGLPVAVKILHGEDDVKIGRFEREAAVLAELQHPAIVRYIAHGITPDAERYLVMEWLEGEDLERRAARKRLTPAEALTLLRVVAGGLATAHARGVLHRDIKPSNIFLSGGDVARAKLLDFGIARLTHEERRLTRTGALVGTPSYMAPEQVQGSLDVDARADVFSLGCVLFECITGRQAFEGTHPMAVLTKILLQQAPSLSQIQKDVPPAVERLVAAMLAKAPADRPADAGEVARALDALGDLGDAWSPLDRTEDASYEPAPMSQQGPPSGALTLREQRFVSLVLASGPPPSEAVTDSLERFGGHLRSLADGSLLVTVWGADSAADRAARAARCAQLLAASSPALSACIVTGRGMVSERVVEGAVIDGGVKALSAARPGVVRIDLATAEMLGSRFLVEPDGEGLALRGERRAAETSPRFLGKPSPCLGRSREISTLDALFSDCAAESSASAALLLGAAGMGKSRVARAFVEKLRANPSRPEILCGRADAIADGAPFGIIADAIRAAAGIQPADSLEARRKRLTARLGQHQEGATLGRTAALLGELIGAPFPDDEDKALRAARGDPQIMAHAIQSAWESFLRAECAVHPVLLLLEDLHWGDLASVRLINETLRDLFDQPLMVLALARPEVLARFPALWSGREVQTIKLGGLPRKACEQILRDALGARLPADRTDAIVKRADGNPFFLEELIRAVIAGHSAAFPDSILAVVEARLDAEGPAAKRILRAASVFGERFPARGVTALLGGVEQLAEVSRVLDKLSAVEIITTTDAEGSGYAFRHAFVREAAYAMLTEADRALGHKLAGAWLEDDGYPGSLAIAEHFSLGGEPARATRWFLRAAEQALEANDLDAAVARAARAALTQEPRASPMRGEIRLVEAEAHLWRGEITLADARSAEAAGLLEGGTAAWFRAVSVALIATGKLRRVEDLERWSFAARDAFPVWSARSARILCLCTSAKHLWLNDRHGAADALIKEIDRTIEEIHASDPVVIATVSSLHGLHAMTTGDTWASAQAMKIAVHAFEEIGDHKNACITRSELGLACAESGDLEGAEAHLRAAMTAADRAGLSTVAALARHCLGPVLASLGQVEEGRRIELEAAALFHAHGDRRLEGRSLAYLAKIAILGGDPVSAERSARDAEALLATSSVRSVALAVLARALLAQGRADDAISPAEEALRLLEAEGAIEEGEALIRLTYAEALAARGQEGEFRAAIRAACDHLLERAAKISDPEGRERFLRGVPDHARTLALAAG